MGQRGQIHTQGGREGEERMKKRRRDGEKEWEGRKGGKERGRERKGRGIMTW